MHLWNVRGISVTRIFCTTVTGRDYCATGRLVLLMSAKIVTKVYLRILK
jgi:hypothetical protein